MQGTDLHTGPWTQDIEFQPLCSSFYPWLACVLSAEDGGGWEGKLLSPSAHQRCNFEWTEGINETILNACMIQRWFLPSLHGHKTSNLFTRGWRAATLFWQNELAAFHWPVTLGDNIELDWELIPLIIYNLSWLFFSTEVLIKLHGPSVFKECEYLPRDLRSNGVRVQ